MTPFGERLRQLRAERNMTQKQMAARIGVSALEHGHRGVPSWVLLQRIIACLNIIWDDADELQRLALQSAPKVTIDTSGMHPMATELANLLQQSIAGLSAEDLETLIHRLRVLNNRSAHPD